MERRRRDRRRHHRHAVRRERHGGHPGRGGEAGVPQVGPAGRRGDHHGLRPVEPDRAGHRQPAEQVAGRESHRRPGLHHLPGPLPLGPGGHPHPADQRARRLPGHVLAGDQRQHHVPGRDRHRHRHAGGRRYRHDREHPQAHGAGPREERSLAHRARRHEGSGAVPLLLSADHHALLRADLRPAGPGGPALQAAGLYQDVHDGRGRPAGHHLRAGADGIPGPGPDAIGTQEPAQPAARVPLPARDPGGDTREVADRRRRGGCPVRHVVSIAADRIRVHAAPLRRRPALHAHHGPEHLDHQGPPAPAADRPDHQFLSRGGAGIWKGGAGRYGHRSGAAVHDRDHHHAKARGGVAAGHDPGRTRGGAQRRHPVPRPDQRVDHAHPHPDRHAVHRYPHPRRHKDHGGRPGRTGGPGRTSRRRTRRIAGHAQRLSREDHGRELPGLRDRPCGGGPVWHDRRRRAGHHQLGGGRRGRDLHGGGAGALPGKRPLCPGVARRRLGLEARPDPDANGCPDPHQPGGRHPVSQGTGRNQVGERPAHGLGVRRFEGYGHRRVCRHRPAPHRGKGLAPRGIQHGLERPVRVPGTGAAAAADRRARHPGHHSAAALHELPQRRGQPDRHAVAALRAGGGRVAHVPAGLRLQHRGGRRIHRAGRRGGGNRSRHAALSQTGLPGTGRPRRAEHP